MLVATGDNPWFIVFLSVDPEGVEYRGYSWGFVYRCIIGSITGF